MTPFADLGLGPDILRSLDDAGYTKPTPVQEQAIPQVLMMRDVLAVAQTGTGKTASFVLPMLEMLGSGRARARMPRSLILEPTRELAAQVAENFQTYGKYHKLSMALVVGGSMMDEQIKNLDRGVDVVIATPGRMIDLYERGKIMLNDIKIFVIDEADRMLDMGFIPDVEKIGKLLPQMKQTLFFSATMPPEIRKLSEGFLRNPKTVTVAPPATTSATIRQAFVMLPTENGWQKREALRMLLARENVQNAFIFCNRKVDVAMLHQSLVKHGLNAGALHGDMDQSERTATLDRFKRGEVTLLVCSDVAARGLDVDAVGHVFNFDVPFHAEDYVHRIGRTGRAGLTGVAYSLVTPEDLKQIDAIEKLIKQTVARETLADLPEPLPQNDRHRSGGRGERGSRGHSRKPSRAHHEPRHRNQQRHEQHPAQPAQVAQQGAQPQVLPVEPPHTAEPPKHRAPSAHTNTVADRFHPDQMPAFLRRPVAR